MASCVLFLLYCFSGRGRGEEERRGGNELDPSDASRSKAHVSSHLFLLLFPPPLFFPHPQISTSSPPPQCIRFVLSPPLSLPVSPPIPSHLLANPPPFSTLPFVRQQQSVQHIDFSLKIRPKAK